MFIHVFVKHVVHRHFIRSGTQAWTVECQIEYEVEEHSKQNNRNGQNLVLNTAKAIFVRSWTNRSARNYSTDNLMKVSISVIFHVIITSRFVQPSKTKTTISSSTTCSCLRIFDI